jgi:cytochrome c
LALIAVLCAPAGLTRPASAQDAAAGEQVFKTNCSICHSVQPQRNIIGPSLFGVVGRHSGQVPGFHYSEAMISFPTGSFFFRAGSNLAKAPLGARG